MVSLTELIGPDMKAPLQRIPASCSLLQMQLGQRSPPSFFVGEISFQAQNGINKSGNPCSSP